MKQYIADAFAEKLFTGNPAAVCVMDHWPSDETLMKITMENNLSETAFAVKENDKYRLRWFSLGGELELVGHATLACAYIILNYIEKGSTEVVFDTLSGELPVIKKGELYEMNFPAYNLKQVPVTKEMTEAIGAEPRAAYMGRDLLCVFDDEAAVRNMKPDLEKVKKLDGLLLHITAHGENTDSVSRTFAPKCNMPEDPVCGSGHCHIVPYWAKTLDQEEVIAYQASARGGTLYCKMVGDRILMAGKAALYSIGEIFID